MQYLDHRERWPRQLMLERKTIYCCEAQFCCCPMLCSRECVLLTATAALL